MSRQILIGYGLNQGHEHGHEEKKAEGEAEEKKGGEVEEQWVTVQSMGSKPLATIKSLPTGAFVRVRVRAKSEKGFSLVSDVGGPFQALDPVRVLEVSPHSMKIIWQTVPAKPVLHFELQIRQYNLILSEDDYRVVADDVPQCLTGIEYFVDGLRPGAEYNFRWVRAKPAPFKSE